jgi:hypothetical protein
MVRICAWPASWPNFLSLYKSLKQSRNSHFWPLMNNYLEKNKLPVRDFFIIARDQSWNRSKFFGPDRTGRSDFSDRTGPVDTGRSIFLTGPVKNRQKTGRSKFWTWPAKNRSLIILDLTGEKPVRCMYQFTNQFFRETVCRFSSTET